MSNRRTPKKAAQEIASLASPARQSRRIRGVKAELDLNALEEIEKRNRRSRSRSRSTSVSLPSQIATPQNVVSDDAFVGSLHVDFDQTASSADGLDAGGDGDETLRVVDFAVSDEFGDLAPAVGKLPAGGQNNRKALAAMKTTLAAKTLKKTPTDVSICRSSRRSTAATNETPEGDEEELSTVDKISVSLSKRTTIVEPLAVAKPLETSAKKSPAKKKQSPVKVTTVEVDASDDDEVEEQTIGTKSAEKLPKKKESTASPAKEKISVSPAKKQKISISPAKTINKRMLVGENSAATVDFPQDDKKGEMEEEADEPTASQAVDDFDDEEVEEGPVTAKKRSSTTPQKSVTAAVVTSSEDEEKGEDEDELAKKKAFVSPLKSKVSVSPSPTKKRTSVGEKPTEPVDFDDEEDEKVDEPTVEVPGSGDEDETQDEKQDASETAESKAVANEDDEEEAKLVENKKSLSALPTKQLKSADKTTEFDADEEEQDDDENLFDDANSTMDVDELVDDDDEDDDPEAKVRRRNLIYEADVENAAAVEQRRKKYKKSVVDDEFFRLEEMNEFLDAQDRLDAKRRLGKFDAADQMADLIEHYEMENLQPRSWELSGEVTAEARDKDTLLDNFVDADFQSKAAPTITSEITEQLESIILKRIKDKIFDDVERKQRRDDLVANYRAKTAFDETVRRSLADVYEEEFQAAQTEKDSDERKMDPVVAEIKKDMDTLFAKLDALSHYQFVPPKVRPELKIVKNVASLCAEEVGPLASTAAADALLAPEEVADHLKAVPKANDERDATDRNRQRRKKKLKQKALAKKGLINKENSGKEIPNGFLIKKTIVKKGKVLVKGRMTKRRTMADADATTD